MFICCNFTLSSGLVIPFQTFHFMIANVRCSLTLYRYKVRQLKIKRYPSTTGCGVMFATRPCSPGTLFYTFLPGKLTIFSFIITKFIISNFVLHNAVHKLTRKCGFLDKMTCPAKMGGRRTSLHKQ